MTNDLSRGRHEAALGDQGARPGLFDEYLKLGCRHSGVERYEDRPEPGAGEQALEQLRATGPEVSDPIAINDASFPQLPRQYRNPLLEHAIGDITALQTDGSLRRRTRCRVADPPGDVHSKVKIYQ